MPGRSAPPRSRRARSAASVDPFEILSEWATEKTVDILDWATDGDAQQQAIIAGPTKDWPLARLDDALTIAIAYALFVMVVPPLLRGLGVPPLRGLTRPIQFVYNPLQVALCAYMVIQTFVVARENDYVLVGNKFDTKNAPIANLLWLFYVSKVLDFVDTFCIVLNQKWDQLSFLHVYHHITIFLVYWLNLRVGYDGDIYLTIILNGFIHFVMYTYYFISMHGNQIAARTSEGRLSLEDLKATHGVSVSLNIWWKKYLTMLQMIQFLCMNAQALYLMFVFPNPQFPRNVTLAYLIYIQSLFWLFLRFFIASYGSPGKKKRD